MVSGLWFRVVSVLGWVVACSFWIGNLTILARSLKSHDQTHKALNISPKLLEPLCRSFL